jgi:meiotic recombination protein SPO11
MEGLLDGSESSPLTASLMGRGGPDVVFHEYARQNPQTGVMIAKIEEILAVMIDALKDTRILTIPLRSRSTGRELCVRFPSSRDREVKKFSGCMDISREHTSSYC